MGAVAKEKQLDIELIGLFAIYFLKCSTAHVVIKVAVVVNMTQMVKKVALLFQLWAKMSVFLCAVMHSRRSFWRIISRLWKTASMPSSITQ
ncbi:hypothetical protein CKO09_01615 [Chromatium weissei]|nr:hypothetical protein [Chromatium weissei]